MVFQDEIHLRTQQPGEMHDLTEQVRDVVARSGIKAGIVHVFNVGSTAGIGTIEFEPGLVKDLPAALEKLAPRGARYAHEDTWHDGNGHSHVQATLLGPSLTVPVRQGELVLGTWQQIFHIECDIRARQRTVCVTVMGE
ncbi:secondary thiamine-phosphate synthase enzyme [Planctomycetaceae bacterium SCGC AG-212-F19]|nr:secondary thiamine-phosphate synthase enzyme [Planctomycetaceae bacterium SCGC AG-212-F19]